MKKRIFPILSIVLLLISLVAPGIQPVAAEEKEDVVYKDGEYEVTAKALHADKDEASGAAKFINENAKINISGGEVKLAFTIPRHEMAEITGMQVEGADPVKEEKDDSIIYTYKLKELKENLNAQVQYEVPVMDMKHDVPLRFKLEGLVDIPAVEDGSGNEDSEDGDTDKGEGNPGEDSDKPGNEDEGNFEETDEDKSENEPSLKELQDGYYNVDASYINEKTGKDSAMARYLSDKTFVEIKDGKAELTVTVTDSNTVTKLEIENTKPIKQLVEQETRHEVFTFTDLSPELNAYVEYEAPMGGGQIHKGKAEFLISLDEQSIKEVKPSDKPTGEVIEDEKTETPKDPVEEEKPSKGFNLSYTFYEKGKDEVSTMDNFKKGPAKIKEDNEGNYVVAMELTSANMIEYLKVGKQDAKVVKENKDKNTKVFEFKLKKLTKKHEAKVKVNVPGMYSTEHTVDLVFDDVDMVVKEVASGENIKVRGKDRLDIKGSKVSILMPASLQAGTDFKVDILKKDFTAPKGYKIAGDIIDVTTNFDGKLKNDEDFIITLGYDKDKFSKNDVDIYYYDEKKSKWIPQKAVVDERAGTLTVGVKHFSKYGVLAKEKKVEKQGSKKKSEEKLKVTDFNYKEMDYTFYKSGTMEKSTMDDFSKGKAIVRTNKKNGKQYATLTFGNPEMIKYIKVNDVDAQVIKKNKKEVVVDFPIQNVNKKQSVKAFIEVPGMYATEHAVDLVFDTGSAIDLSSDAIPSYLKNHIEDPEKPSQTSGGNGSGSGTPTDPGPDFNRDADGNIINANNDSGSGINPKTADLNMTQIMLFGSLLLLSLIPLVIKLRRRFVTEE